MTNKKHTARKILKNRLLENLSNFETGKYSDYESYTVFGLDSEDKSHVRDKVQLDCRFMDKSNDVRNYQWFVTGQFSLDVDTSKDDMNKPQDGAKAIVLCNVISEREESITVEPVEVSSITIADKTIDDIVELL